MASVRESPAGWLGGLPLVVLALWLLCPGVALSQELEPRSLTNVPVGMNFAIAGYGYSSGDILLDPTVPIEIRNSTINTFVGAYVRAIDFFGYSSKIDVVGPYALGEWSGTVQGRDSSTSRTGPGDPRIRLSVNFVGAPALPGPAYRDYRQRTIIGASLQVIMPLGQYDPDRLINLGSNRWTFRPQLGMSRARGEWIVETFVDAWLSTKNSDFLGGNEMQQEPLYTIKVHAIHTIPRRRIWAASDAGYAIGGRTLVNGVETDSRISTFRFGLDLAFPLARQHTVKVTFTKGVRHERGSEFGAIAANYQYAWGGR